MTWAQAILLGLIQGITEFLPISSSAHLILLPFVLGWGDHSLHFDIITNAGTLLAAVIYFRRDLAAVGREILASARPEHATSGPAGGTAGLGLARAVFIASIPIMVVALLFYEWFATVARQPVVIASTSIGFGLIMWWADRVARHERDVADLTWRDCAWIGLAQAVALIPGTSRSGITMTVGLFLGLDRFAAARFSFLLAIPVGILALAKDVADLARGDFHAAELIPLAIGFVVSALSAYLVIGWLLSWLQRQNLTLFVIYRVALGFLIFGFLYLR